MKKNRKEIPTQYPDIFKILVLISETGKWTEPARGKKFKARRYSKKFDGSLERTKRSFETLAEAKAFRLGAPDLTEPVTNPVEAKDIGPTSELTFSQLLDKWKLSWLPTKDLATQGKYISYLKHLRFFKDMRVDDIDPDCIDRWIVHIKTSQYLNQGHRTRSNYIHEMSCLRVILNYYCARLNRNYRLPFLRDHRSMLKVKEMPMVKKDLTVDQFSSFMNHLKSICWETKWESIYYLALMQYALYARVQSAAAIHVEDFDLTNNRLEMTKKVQWLQKYGYEDRIVSGSKTDGGKIFTPIPALAARVFKESMIRSGIRSGLLFRVDGKLVCYRAIEHRYNRALKAAGLPFTATHLIRHAALSEAYNVCHDILAVKEFANHKDLKATQKYAKVRDEQIAKTQRQMDERISSIWK